jgi:hypothetical protein
MRNPLVGQTTRRHLEHLVFSFRKSRSTHKVDSIG